jgi:hypothetical protein
MNSETLFSMALGLQRKRSIQTHRQVLANTIFF